MATAKLLLVLAALFVSRSAFATKHPKQEHNKDVADGVVLTNSEYSDETDDFVLQSLLSGYLVFDSQPQTHDDFGEPQDGEEGEGEIGEDYYDYDANAEESHDPATVVNNNDVKLGLGLSAEFIKTMLRLQTPDSFWYKGPNVCKRVVEYTQELSPKTSNSDSRRGRTANGQNEDPLAQCYETESTYQCKTESRVSENKKLVNTIILECCEGFRRVEQGCIYVKNLTDLITTAKRHDAALFGKEAAKVYSWMSRGAGGNVTVFAPLDKHVAFAKEGARKHPQSELAAEQREIRLRAVHPTFDELVPAHVVDGYAFSSTFEDDKLIASHWPGAHIRINVYDAPKKLVTANCLPLKSTNHLATNGLLHLLDGILMPATSTIWHRLLNDKRFSRFAEMVQEEFPEDMLGLDHPGHLTIFVPTNMAIEQLKDKRTVKVGEICTSRLIRRHILLNVVCSQAIEGAAKFLSLDGSELRIQRIASGIINVANKASVITADIMATNGVIHFIDDIILMPEDIDSDDKISAEQLAEFNFLLGNLDVRGDLMKNVTLFIPSKEAIDDITRDVAENELADAKEVEKLVKYHIARGILFCDKFSHQVNTSLGVPIRMQTYVTFPFEHVVHTANCVRIVKKNMRTCRSIVHEVEEVLIPPSRNILSILASHPNLTEFARILQKSSIYNELVKGTRSYTMYVPTDEAMKEALAENLDEEALNRLALRHIVAGYKCCTGIFPSPYYTRVDTEAGGHVKLVRDQSGSIHMSGDVSVTACDAVGTNGVVHIVDKVIPAHLLNLNGKLPFPYYSVL